MDQTLLIWHEPTLNEGNPMTVTTHAERTYPERGFTRGETIDFWNTYLDARSGTYEFRCRRFDAVIDRLFAMGMRYEDTIMDVGAGRMEFGRRLREKGHTGMYVPVDGSIDGCDLNTWHVPTTVHWIVSIETIEHVHDPKRLMRVMQHGSLFGMVVTTPNAAVVDVMAMDPTHLVPLTTIELKAWGYDAYALSLFLDGPEDTIIAHRGSRD